LEFERATLARRMRVAKAAEAMQCMVPEAYPLLTAVTDVVVMLLIELLNVLIPVLSSEQTAT